MAGLGRRKLAEMAPDHPFARPQISFETKHPPRSKKPSPSESEAEKAPAKPTKE